MINNSKRIYILGNVGCGKTTLSSKLSLKMKIPFYELDNVVWEYHESGDIKRNDEEIEKLFLNIIYTPQWIIEDVGRDKFKMGLEISDTIIFLDISKRIRHIQIFKRWIRQKIGLEKSRYNPTLKMLFKMYVWSNKFEKNKKDLLKILRKYDHKLITINENNYNDLFIV